MSQFSEAHFAGSNTGSASPLMAPVRLPMWAQTFASFLIALALFITSPAIGTESVRERLATESLIRVYVSPAPGFGHQAATVTVMRRLRQLGFTGNFEIVYADSIASKLVQLLPGFDASRSEWQNLESFGARAISLSRFTDETNLRTVTLGLTGADDDRRFMGPERLRVKSYLRLQPLGWGTSDLLVLGAPAQPIPGLNGLGYLYDVNDRPAELENVISEMRKAPETSQKAESLRAILADAASGRAYIGAIYGIGLIGNISGRIKLWVEAIQTAQRVSAESFRGPIILPIISGLNAQELKSLRWDLSMDETGRSRAHRGHKEVRLLDANDSEQTREALRSAGSGAILLIQVGKIPQLVFEALFATSRLPILVAGKNAMNLAQLLGRPYLNTVGDYSLSQTPSQGTGATKRPVGLSAEAAKIFLQAAEAFHYSQSGTVHHRRVAKFILAAMNRESELSRFFRALGPGERDKVAEAVQSWMEWEKTAKGPSPGVARADSRAKSCRALFAQGSR